MRNSSCDVFYCDFNMRVWVDWDEWVRKNDVWRTICVWRSLSLIHYIVLAWVIVKEVDNQHRRRNRNSFWWLGRYFSSHTKNDWTTQHTHTLDPDNNQSFPFVFFFFSFPFTQSKDIEWNLFFLFFSFSLFIFEMEFVKFIDAFCAARLFIKRKEKIWNFQVSPYLDARVCFDMVSLSSKYFAIYFIFIFLFSALFVSL